MTTLRSSSQLSQDGSTLTVRMPLAMRRRGGRKVVVSPNGAEQGPWTAPARLQVDNTLVHALARAFRWKEMLDSGRYATVSELAAAEKLDRSFVSHILRLTLLSPHIVEAILDGKQAATLQLKPLVRALPVEWKRQGS